MDYAGVVILEIVYMIAFLALTSAGLAIRVILGRRDHACHDTALIGHPQALCDPA